MPENTKPIPDAYHAMTPYLIVDGAAKSIDWYRDVFGAIEVLRLADPTGKVMHAEISIGGSTLMLADEFPDMGYRGPSSLGGSPVSILLYVDDVDATFSRAVSAGASEKTAVADQFDGDRRGSLTDPFGHVWLLATRKEKVSLEEMRQRFEKMMRGT